MAKLYGPAPTTAYKVTALTNNSGFNATTFMSKWESVKGAMLYPPTTLTTVVLSNNTTEARVRLDKGGGVFEIITIFSYTTGAYNDEGAVWGFASEPQAGDFTSTQETRMLSKRVAKLYGPISDGQGGYETKLIKKLYGPADFLADFAANQTMATAGFVTAFDEETFVSTMETNHPQYLWKGAWDFSTIELRVSYVTPTYGLGLWDTTTSTLVANFVSGTKSDVEAYGFTFGASPSNNSRARYAVTSPVWTQKTKLIYEAPNA